MQEPDHSETTIRWSVAQRLEFIEFRLVWEGRINRSDIAEQFGVKVQQASADLGLYDSLAPGNMHYLRNAKTFVPSPAFEPKFLRKDADRQLLQLAAIGGGLIEARDSWFHDLPSMAVVPTPAHGVSTETVRWLLEAIRHRKAIEILYQSMDRPEPMARMIEPHSLGHDGRRWHARAWCPRNNAFRDFQLSRIEAAGLQGPAVMDREADREWWEEVVLILAPNPNLKEGARRSLSREYGMERGRLRVTMRVALAWYAIRSLNLDLEGLEPQRQQLVLTNRDQVDEVCRRAETDAKEAIAAAKSANRGPQ